MIMTGQFRIALLPNADSRRFIDHMKNVVFGDSSTLQLTRITRSFTHQLLEAPMRQYVWQVRVNLETGAGYDFAENAGRIQDRIGEFGVLVEIEAFTNVE
jgi:hypothetical protein